MNMPISTESVFDPIRPDFADFDVEVENSFRWAIILDHLGVPVNKYVALYAFRSVIGTDANMELLQSLDEKALLAAEDAKGFIHYEPHLGLSYCLWQSTADAFAATSGPEHREAAKQAATAYERWELQSWMIANTGISNHVNFE